MKANSLGPLHLSRPPSSPLGITPTAPSSRLVTHDRRLCTCYVLLCCWSGAAVLSSEAPAGSPLPPRVAVASASNPPTSDGYSWCTPGSSSGATAREDHAESGGAIFRDPRDAHPTFRRLVPSLALSTWSLTSVAASAFLTTVKPLRASLLAGSSAVTRNWGVLSKPTPFS